MGWDWSLWWIPTKKQEKDRKCLPADCVPTLLSWWWSLGLCGRTAHVWQVQGETPEQTGHGGLRRARTVEVRFQDPSVHQTCLCKWTRDGVTPEEDPTSLENAKLESATWEGSAGTIQTRYRGPGSRGNWHCLPLTFSTQWAGFVILMIWKRKCPKSSTQNWLS